MAANERMSCMLNNQLARIFELRGKRLITEQAVPLKILIKWMMNASLIYYQGCCCRLIIIGVLINDAADYYD